MTVTERRIPTPHGEARLELHSARGPFVTLLLSHGAGAGIETADLQALARDLPRHGVTVVLLEQPWRVAGRKVATAPQTLDDGLVAAANRLRTRSALVVGGRSAGARSAARCARRLGASGLIALSFPLHPAGKPERSRADELRGARVPTLVLQGERDPMGRPEELPGGIDLVVVPEADHSLRVPRRAALTPADVEALIVESTLEWLTRTIPGSGPGNGPGNGPAG